MCVRNATRPLACQLTAANSCRWASVTCTCIIGSRLLPSRRPPEACHTLDYVLSYDPRRILLGDVDGDGAADLVYVDDTTVTLWINQGGNGWSAPLQIEGTPPVTDLVDVRLADVRGSGISGVLWTAEAEGLSARAHMYFLDFTGGIKPHLLNEMDNHLGAVTRRAYAPSNPVYLEDQQPPATRWETPLTFPVPVLARVE